MRTKFVLYIDGEPDDAGGILTRETAADRIKELMSDGVAKDRITLFIESPYEASTQTVVRVNATSPRGSETARY